MRLATLTLALLLLASTARAQTPGQCTLGQAQARLDLANVEATLFNTGSLFFGGTTTNADGYVVPRFSGKSPVYAAGLWVGGTVGGEVRAAGSRYSQFEFWPGPLGATGSPVNPATCAAYDRIYVVSQSDVAAYEQTGTATPDLAEWPVGLGAAALDAAGQPIVPASPSQTLNLAAGERPVVYGSQTAFWVMNDAGNAKLSTQSAPLGVEVRVHAFVVASAEAALAQATFYRYELVYRGAAPLEGARVSLFVDPDLGYANDDYVGTDVSRGMAYVYNADNADDGSSLGYGTAPPAAGYDFLDGTGASSYFSSSGATRDPVLAAEVYNFQQGLWRDGTPMRAYGTGYGQTQGEVTTFMFSGDPVTGHAWSEGNPGTGTPFAPGDRRQVVSSAPFTLQPGQSRTVDLAILYARGSSNLASITALRQASDRVQALHDDGSLYRPGLVGSLPSTPAAPALLAPAAGADLGVATQVLLDWAPVPNATSYSVEVSTNPDFPTLLTRRTDTQADTLTFFPTPNTRSTYYWRVRAFNDIVGGTPSEVRSFTAKGPYQAFPEGVEERDAAGVVIDTDLVNSLNSTTTRPPTYLVGAGGAASDDSGAGTATGVLERIDYNGYLTANAPREYELRWVDPAQGQVVLNRGWDRTTPGRAYLNCLETGTAPSNTAAPTGLVTTPAPLVGGYPRMPFQVWEIEPDGTERQVHANVIDDDADLCYSFTTPANSGAAPLAGFGYERIYGSRVPYVESELVNPVDVHARSNVLDAASQAFGRLSILFRTGPARPPLAGTRIRITTTDDLSTAAEAPPSGADGIAIEVTRPNPVRSRALVRFTTGAAGPVRLTVVDVLGRRVAVLAEGARAAGPHEATLDGRRLAPGVYLLVLEAGGARAVRSVTVVR